MEKETLEFLLNLNQDFYDTYAKSFSSTRFSIQPGIQRLMPQFQETTNLFDLGCGNGNLAKALLEADFSGCYLGVDNSSSLLSDAADAIPENKRGRYTFRQRELTVQFQDLQETPGFDSITCFAVIHHFPLDPYLNQFFKFAEQRLSTNGKLYFSTWQVKNSRRLSSHIQPWSLLNFDNQELGENDLLIDWRADPGQPARYRYVHHYDSETLRNTGFAAGLNLEEEFFSDGKEGDLALYQVWSKPAD